MIRYVLLELHMEKPNKSADELIAGNAWMVQGVGRAELVKDFTAIVPDFKAKQIRTITSLEGLQDVVDRSSIVATPVGKKPKSAWGKLFSWID